MGVKWAPAVPLLPAPYHAQPFLQEWGNLLGPSPLPKPKLLNPMAEPLVEPRAQAATLPAPACSTATPAPDGGLL